MLTSHSYPTTPPLLPKSRSTPRLNSSSEWLHRTADALTASTRESKGQSWLTTRASSTSLVAEGEDRGALGDDERSLAMSPMWGAAEEEDYMAAGHAASAREWEEEEEEAVGGVYRLGQIIDRLIGWSVFGEDESDSEEEGKRMEEERGRERIRIARPEEERAREEQRRRRDMDEGWQEPAWIFSIASNVLF